MRLHEIVSPRLYLGSSEPLKGIVESLNNVRFLDEAREAKLEARRPADRLPRRSSILLHESRGCGGDHIYAVEVIGQTDRLHTGWLTKLAECDMDQDGVASSFADRYWNGAETPDDRGAPWELRVSQARVLERVGGKPLRYGYPKARF